MGGQSVGISIHHHLFLTDGPRREPSVAGVSLSRRPSFSSVSTLKDAWSACLAVFATIVLPADGRVFRIFFPPHKWQNIEVGSVVEGIFLPSADSGQAATTLDPKMFDLTKHGTLNSGVKLSISISSRRSWNWARDS